MGSSYTKTTGVRCLLLSQRIMRSLVAHLEAMQSALFMGLLDDAELQRYDAYPFDESHMTDMRAEAVAGLELWERDIIKNHFGRVKSLLIIGAAGAREMVGFAERGFRVEGIDYSEHVVQRSNEVLAAIGAAPTIAVAPRFELPFAAGRFDGIVIARKFYSMIHNRRRRIELLARVRRLLPEGSPLLVSFFTRSRNTIAFRMQASFANLLRRLHARPADIEIGDHLDPESPLLHHHFTTAEIRAEFAAAGFLLAHCGETSFGHAVGVAAPMNEATSKSNTVSTNERDQRNLGAG